MLLKELFWPSTANATVLQEKITTSRQLIKKNVSSSANSATLHDSNLPDIESKFNQHFFLNFLDLGLVIRLLLF